jgi:DnaK suppressor protein
MKRPGEQMMTTTAASPVDLHGIRNLLQGLYLELSAECDEANAALALIGTAGAGDDEGDAGAKSAQRDQQLTLVTSIRERREQVEHALERLDEGRYGRCERCQEPIVLERLAAFPAATHCVDCKRFLERD